MNSCVRDAVSLRRTRTRWEARTTKWSRVPPRTHLQATRVMAPLLSVAGRTSSSSSPAFQAVVCVRTMMEMSKTSLQAQMCMRTPAETTAASSAPAKVAARQRAPVLVCAQSRQRSDVQKVNCDQRSLVRLFVVATRACGRIRRC